MDLRATSRGKSNDAISRSVASQVLASLTMLKDCADRCPIEEWQERRGDYPFSQVVFHALFDCDYHMSDDEAEFKAQAFHLANIEAFADYGELADEIPERLYERDFIGLYVEHCRAKVIAVIESKAKSDLIIPNSDIRGNMTLVERYINLIRHVQHHAAQLGLRLQLASGKEMNWVSRGYEC